MHGFMGRSHDKRQGRVASVPERRPSMRKPENGAGAGTRAGSRHCSPAFSKQMWLFWLALLIAIAFGCSFLAPSSGLHASALRAFEASVSELSRGGGANISSSDEGDELGVLADSSAPAPPLRSVRSAPRPTPPLKTSNIRKRVTPLMQKRVAARYGFKCAICGCLLRTRRSGRLTTLSR